MSNQLTQLKEAIYTLKKFGVKSISLSLDGLLKLEDLLEENSIVHGYVGQKPDRIWYYPTPISMFGVRVRARKRK